VQKIGWPEGRIPLSECALYLANSPKSNSAYQAINQAQELVQKTGNLPVPLHLRNAPTKLMKELGYGDEYRYSHDYPKNFVAQEYLPEAISGRPLYQPGDNSAEKKTSALMEERWSNKYSG